MLAAVWVAALLGVDPAAQQQGERPAAPDAPPARAQEPAAAEPAAQEPQPTFRTGINFVRVDVIVTDNRQQPVTDLTQDDFEVLEDGRPQAIEQFRLVRIDGNPAPGAPPPREIRNALDEETEAARDDVRLFLIFLDDYHVRVGNAIAVREPLTRFLQTQLRPEDMVAVMYPLTPLDDIAFTRDHARIVREIQGFEGRKFRYDARNQFEEQYARAPTETVEQIRNQVVMTALRGAATRLGSLREGRKSLLYVSEGLTVLLPPQMRNQDASIPCLTPLQPGCNPAVGSPIAGERDPREDTARAFAQAELNSRLRDVYDAANRNNTSIYALDPRGLAAAEFGIDENIGPTQDASALRATQDTLRVLAEETDGRAIVNRNDLAPALAQVVRDASAYYLLGYTSTQTDSDGKFHEISVRVRRRGLDVRARKGYWAATVADAIRAATPAAGPPRRVEQALAAIATSVYSGKYIRTWVGTERGADGKTRVTVVWEPVQDQPGARRDQPGRVSLLAATEQGDLLFRGRSDAGALSSAAPSATPVGRAAARASGPQRLAFEAGPGNVELRLSVEAEGGGVIDNEVRTIVVPDLTGPDSGLSTPRVYRARNARELQQIAANADAVPVAGREFSRTERLLVRFDAYTAGTPTAALLNRSGQKMADLPVTPAAAGGTHQIDMGLNTMPAGEYLIEIAVPGAPDGASQLFAIRIAN
jgi:VWFA-related protein